MVTPLAVLVLTLAGASASGFESEPFTAPARPFLFQRQAAPAPRAFQPVCSALDFSGVAWPPSLTPADQEALKAALNITGSFEGGSAWSNLTDDFDGQGLSLGLLSQNLGQGSLQPLLLKLDASHPEVLAAKVGLAHRKSLRAMLSAWQSAAAMESAPELLSPLDEPQDGSFRPLAAGANAASVAWAKTNLYKAGDFDPVWRAELTSLAASPEYVSQQVAAALDYHTRALKHQVKADVRELRAYLMLFDINVQNGGIYPQDFTDYAAYVKAAPEAAAEQKLEKLLELRLRHVRARFMEDVRSRKTAIIKGKGTVHGAARDLPVQYCYDASALYR